MESSSQPSIARCGQQAQQLLAENALGVRRSPRHWKITPAGRAGHACFTGFAVSAGSHAVRQPGALVLGSGRALRAGLRSCHPLTKSSRRSTMRQTACSELPLPGAATSLVPLAPRSRTLPAAEGWGRWVLVGGAALAHGSGPQAWQRSWSTMRSLALGPASLPLPAAREDGPGMGPRQYDASLAAHSLAGALPAACSQGSSGRRSVMGATGCSEAATKAQLALPQRGS